MKLSAASRGEFHLKIIPHFTMNPVIAADYNVAAQIAGRIEDNPSGQFDGIH